MTQITSVHTVDAKYHNWQFCIRRWRKSGERKNAKYHNWLSCFFASSFQSFSKLPNQLWYFSSNVNWFLIFCWLWDFLSLNCVIRYDTTPLKARTHETHFVSGTLLGQLTVLLWLLRWCLAKGISGSFGYFFYFIGI